MNSGHSSSAPASTRPPAGEDRLSSWKEIAAYLGRDIRTVQRWERTQRLPVHRHRHNRLSTAYAFKSELDEWWHNHPPSDDNSNVVAPNDHPENGLPSLDARHDQQQPLASATNPTESRPSAHIWRRLTIGMTVAVCVIAAFAAYAWLHEGKAEGGVPFGARDFVLISSFENRTGDEIFDGSVEYALERELSNSTFVNVVPRERVQDTLELMQRPLDTRLDVDLAREVALRDGQIRVLLAGRVERFGTRYVLTADILRISDGALAASVGDEAAGESEVLAAIRRLSVQVRRKLGENLAFGSSSPPVPPRVTTKSLRALQLFARAWDAIGWNENAPVNQRAAEQLLRQAIEIDPDFAQAHMLLANIARGPDRGNLGPHHPTLSDRAAMLPHVERAVAAAERAPELERLLVDADAQLFRSRYVAQNYVARREAMARAQASLEAIVRLQPDDFVALTRLARLTQGLGYLTRAGELAVRLAEMRPTSARAQVYAARLSMENGDLTGARRYVERARELRVPPTHYAPDLAIWLALFEANEAWLTNDAPRALAVADRFAGEAPRLSDELRELTAVHLFFIYLSLGRLQQANAVVDDLPAYMGQEGRDQQRGRVLALRGNRQALAAFLSQRFPTAERAQGVGSNLIDAGLFEIARGVIDYHRRQDNKPPFEWYSGQLALVEGRIDEAIRRLTTASTLFPARNNQGLKIARQLADAHQAAGRHEEALRLLEESTRQRNDLRDGWEWVRSRERLADIYRHAGRASDAQKLDRELAALLAVADDDHATKRRLVERGMHP
jgi:tetratricopeptide (TPR) repeat protein